MLAVIHRCRTPIALLQAQRCDAPAAVCQQGSMQPRSRTVTASFAADACTSRRPGPVIRGATGSMRHVSMAASSGASSEAGSHHGPHVTVVGAGVSGLTSALRILQEVPGSRVTILAGKFGTDTTTAGAAGIWGPYKLSDTPEHLVDRWAGDTFSHLMRLFYSPDGVRAGLSLVLTHYIHTQAEANTPPPSWHKVVFGFQEIDPQHLALLPPQYVHGFSFNNVTCEGRYYLQYLTDEIQKRDGCFVQTRLQSLAHAVDLASSAAGGQSVDAVVDCCGLGASELLGDKEVYPIRGQIMRVRAPWVTQSYFAGDFYIIPNRHSVVLGGTGQVGNWNTQASLEDKARIWRGCCELVPSLVHAEVIEDWVGLRPGRTRLRLELDQLPILPTGGSEGQSQAPHAGAGQGGVPVVHNYGHGGAGLTLGWGCAGDVAQLVKQALKQA